MNKPIYVTQPYLPPLEEIIPYLKSTWESKILSNGGPFHEELESKLCEYLGVEHISLCSNGTMALIIGLQALGISGKVITSPFSFVATSHSLLWNGLDPIFVDVDPISLNLDPSKIEEAITSETTAIMPVHCYGKPCDVDSIQEIADKHNLKIIYDAAHAFAVKCHCGSILNHGDLSILSFHATKVFNTFEGGAIICKDKKTKEYVDHLKNFGFDDEVTVSCMGINGKMNEFQAAVGLAQLNHIDTEIQKRGNIATFYREALQPIKGIRCHDFTDQESENYSYFPIFIEADFPLTRDELYLAFKSEGIFTRRYFYPLISDFPVYKTLSSVDRGSLMCAQEAANKVLCLPIYSALKKADQHRIVDLIKNVLQ